MHPSQSTHTVWTAVPWSRSFLDAYTSEQAPDRLREWEQEWEVMPASEVVCRACGCGDNTIGHWTRWCPVPLIVAISILRPTRPVNSLSQLARMGVKHAVTCTLILASFRRLLRQEGAFLHQTVTEPKRVLWWVTTLHEMVATDAHIALGIDIPITGQERRGAVASQLIRLLSRRCYHWSTAQCTYHLWWESVLSRVAIMNRLLCYR